MKYSGDVYSMRFSFGEGQTGIVEVYVTFKSLFSHFSFIRFMIRNENDNNTDKRKSIK